MPRSVLATRKIRYVLREGLLGSGVAAIGGTVAVVLSRARSVHHLRGVSSEGSRGLREDAHGAFPRAGRSTARGHVRSPLLAHPFPHSKQQSWRSSDTRTRGGIRVAPFSIRGRFRGACIRLSHASGRPSFSVARFLLLKAATVGRGARLRAGFLTRVY